VNRTLVRGRPTTCTAVRRTVPARLETTRNPLLLEINTRVWLHELRQHDGAVHLGTVPDDVLDAIAERGFDLVWMMGVWTTGDAGRAIATASEDLHAGYDAALPGWTDDDVLGSPYAVAAYEVAPDLGGRSSLQTLRARLRDRGIGLVLDFICNHAALDHPWLRSHPEYFVQCDAAEAGERPHDVVEVIGDAGSLYVMHGRDPYFPPWTDTAQLNTLHPGLRRAQREVLTEIAAQCDGVRCDMAMLAMSEIFERTWGDRPHRFVDDGPAAGEYWEEMIGAARDAHPGFLFIAEVYWGMERRILDLGFDYAYDKILYDRLRHDTPQAIAEHLDTMRDCGSRLVRFLENHDEDRARRAFGGEKLRAAATLAYTLPGLRMFHEGQLEGFEIRLPVQLARRQLESGDAGTREFYARLLGALDDPVLRLGQATRLESLPAWDGNASHERVMAMLWDGLYAGQRLVVVNASDTPAQCRVRLAHAGLGGRRLWLTDLIGPEAYLRDRFELTGTGLYLDLAPYQTHLFAIEAGR